VGPVAIGGMRPSEPPFNLAFRFDAGSLNYCSVCPGGSKILQIQQILALPLCAGRWPMPNPGIRAVALSNTGPAGFQAVGQQDNGRLQWQTRGESAAYRIAVNLLVCCWRGEAL
jgi:hypothetical protein